MMRPQYIITLHNGISVLANSLAYRYARLQYKNIWGKDCFVLRCYVIQVQNIMGIAGNSFPVLPTTRALSHGRPCGEYNYDVALKDRPESIGITNHQIAMKQALAMRHTKTLIDREAREREDLQERLKWGDW